MILSPQAAEALAALQEAAELDRLGFVRRTDGILVPKPPPPPPKPEPVLRALLRRPEDWTAHLAQWDDWHGPPRCGPPSFPCIVVSSGALEWRDADGHVDERECWHDFFSVADACDLLEAYEETG